MHRPRPIDIDRRPICICSPQCRGWGTDTAAPDMKELYEQTKRRESLSALSLAITTPRYDACLHFGIGGGKLHVISSLLDRPRIHRRRAWTNRIRRPPRPRRRHCTGRRDLRRGSSRGGRGRRRPPPSPPETRRPRARGRNRRVRASRGIGSGREKPRLSLRAARCTRRRSRGTGGRKVSAAVNVIG